MRPALGLALAITACSGAPAPATPLAPPPAVGPADAAAAVPVVPDAPAPDPAATAAAWIFRYHTAERTETWTLRYAEAHALLVVETAAGAQRYTGTATEDGASLAIAVATPAAKLALTCQHAQRAVSATCNDRKAPPRPVLDCYVAGYQEPMPFAAAPGLEYVVDAHCTGYRLLAP